MTDKSYKSTAPAWLDPQLYPFGHQFVQLRYGSMHYVDEGRGPVVLFVHGTPTWSFEYRHLIRGLSGEFRCVAPDNLGFGLSERPKAFGYTPEAHADSLAEFVERLDLRDITLVVHDFGGPVGLPLAVARPSRVRRVVIFNTWMWPLDDDPTMKWGANLLGGPIGAWLYRHANLSLRVLMPTAYGDRRALTPAIHRHYLELFRDKRARVQVLHALARALNGSRAHYAALLENVGRLADLPALIVWGMKDAAFPPRLLERWRRLLPGADITQLNAVGHWPHEEAPETVITTLRAWLHEPRAPVLMT
jgi:haloalkane dehalogenase